MEEEYRGPMLHRGRKGLMMMMMMMVVVVVVVVMMVMVMMMMMMLIMDIVVHQNIRVSDVIVSDIFDPDHLPIFHILDRTKIRKSLGPY
jgi:cell division septal protein FtsQ